MTKADIIELIKQRLDAVCEQRDSSKYPELIAAYAITAGELAWLIAKIMESED